MAHVHSSQLHRILRFREQKQHLKGYFVTVALMEVKKINMKEVRDAAC